MNLIADQIVTADCQIVAFSPQTSKIVDFLPQPAKIVDFLPQTQIIVDFLPQTDLKSAVRIRDYVQHLSSSSHSDKGLCLFYVCDKKLTIAKPCL
jgi:hypothetical protein